MTPREIVLRAIERRDPPRLPLTYCNRDFEYSDCLSVGIQAAPGWTPSEPGMTEWGYVWHSLDQTMGQPQVRPLADADALESYVPPDAEIPERYAHIESVVAGHPDRFWKGCIGITGFNAATFLRGFEALLEDFVAAPERASRILDLVFEFENAAIRHLCRTPVDAVMFADDWGTQSGLMISPAVWRRLFRDRYAEQFRVVRESGRKVWFHTCGDVSAIMGDLIDIGVDVLELLQPDIFGMDRLAREFGGKVCFCCSVDHQRVASTGSPAQIEAYVGRLVRTLSAFHGGLIGYIEDYASLGMPEENYQAIRSAFAAATLPPT